jgi:hypothetical protein
MLLSICGCHHESIEMRQVKNISPWTRYRPGIRAW